MRHLRAAWLWTTDHLTITVPWCAETLVDGFRGGWREQHRDWQARQARERIRHDQ